MRHFITFSLCLLAGSAAADDTVPATRDPGSSAYEWSGTYAGVSGGYGWMDGVFETSGYPPKDDRLDGVVLGAFAGVNTQFDTTSCWASRETSTTISRMSR